MQARGAALITLLVPELGLVSELQLANLQIGMLSVWFIRVRVNVLALKFEPKISVLAKTWPMRSSKQL